MDQQYVQSVGAEPTQGAFNGSYQMIGTEIMVGLSIRILTRPEFGTDHHLLTAQAQGLSKQLLRPPMAIGIRCVEETDAIIQRSVDRAYGLLLCDLAISVDTTAEI
jgi:hypothetical protein